MILTSLWMGWYIGNVSFPKTHYFRGKVYNLRWRKPSMTKKERKQHKKAGLQLMGKHTPPYYGSAGGMITIDKSLPMEDFADTTLHEALHACFPDLDESAITEASEDITKLFKRMGMKISFE